MAFTESFIIKAIDNFSAVNEKFAKQVSANTDGVNKFSEALSNNYGKLSAMSAAVLGTLGGMTIAAGKVQSAITKTLVIMSPEEVRKFGAEIDKAAKFAIREGHAIDTVGQAIFTMTQAGVKGTQVQSFMRSAVDLAEASYSDLAITTKGLTAVMSAYGKENFNASETARVFFGMHAKGKISVEQLSAVVAQIAPTSKAMGLSFAETSAALATMTQRGVPAEAAIANLRLIFAALRNPSKESAAILRALGITYGMAAIKSKGFGVVLQQIGTAYNKHADALARVMPSARSFAGLSTLGAGALTDYNANLKEFTGNLGGLDRAASMVNDTFTETWADFFGAFKQFSAEIGGTFLPAATKTLRAATDLIKTFSEMPKWLRQLISYGTFAVGVFLGVAGAIGAWSKLSLIVSGLGISLAGIAAVAAPIALLATAVAMNIAIWDDWKTVLGFVWEKLQGILAIIGEISTKGIIGFAIDKTRQMSENIARQKSIAEMKPLPSGISNKTNFSADINIRAPQGVVQGAESKATGFNFAKVGLNMATI